MTEGGVVEVEGRGGRTQEVREVGGAGGASRHIGDDTIERDHRIGRTRSVIPLRQFRQVENGVAQMLCQSHVALQHCLHHLVGSLQVQAEKNRSEEHTSELKSLMRTSYAVFSLKTTIIFVVDLSKKF